MAILKVKHIYDFCRKTRQNYVCGKECIAVLGTNNALRRENKANKNKV